MVDRREDDARHFEAWREHGSPAAIRAAGPGNGGPVSNGDNAQHGARPALRLLVQVENDEPIEVCVLSHGRYDDPVRLALLVDSAAASALSDHNEGL